jgi:ribosomal protein S18 acetylase RimI-like enzyme
MTSGTAASNVTIRRAGLADAERLASFAAAAFEDTFGTDNRPEDMTAYLAEAFGPEVQRAELADEACTVWLAEHDGTVAGYAMVREGAAPRVVGAGRAIEIARLYAGRQWIGMGIGARLMQRCLDDAAARGSSTIWLGVWERNARAIEFYRRWGFSEVGSQTFQLGDDVQTDHIMARRLAGAD